MGVCIEKIKHDVEGCGSHSLQVFEQEDGTINGYCFSCETWEDNPYGDGKTAADLASKRPKAKSKEEILADMAEIEALGCMDLKVRRLRGKYLSHYGVKIGLSERDGRTPTFMFFPYTKAGVITKWKVKLLSPKKMWSVGYDNDVDLFGWEQALASGARRLIITEGEPDAVALHAIIDMNTKDAYKDFKPAVVSLPNGAGCAKRDLSRLKKKISRHFKDVYFCFDSDEPGQKALKEACLLFPSAQSIELPAKDANACILEGKSKAAFKAVTFDSEKPKNTRLVWGATLHEAAKEPPEWGLSWPWEYMTKKTRGIRFGETIYLAAGEKMGKSEVVNALAEHLIVEHKLKVMLAKPEEANNKTYKMLVSKAVGKFFHDPSKEFDESAYERGGALIKDNVCMLNLYQNLTWDVLKGDIQEAAGLGVKAVFIDPITNLVNGLSSSEANETLAGISQDLATLAKDLDIVVFIFCHLNKPTKGSTPWDRGGKITTDYFAGSSAMARSCNYALGFQGNKDPELDQEERNLRDLVVLADREFGESGTCKLYWDHNTGLFNEVTEHE